MKKTLLPLLVIIASALAFIGCGNSKEDSQKTETHPTKPTTDIKYEIGNLDKRDPIININIYLLDTAKMDELNTYLCSQWNPNKDKLLSIYYFDSKKVALLTPKELMESKMKVNAHWKGSYSFVPGQPDEGVQHY